jgi:hypothetical protein
MEVGDDVIDAQHIVFGEHNAAIYDQDLLAVFIEHHILPHLPQATQGNDAKFFVPAVQISLLSKGIVARKRLPVKVLRY